MTILETTQAIYQAFAQGDIPFILGTVSDDVTLEAWADNEAVRSGKIPYLRSRNGKTGMAEFFASLSAIDLRDFQVHGFLASAHQVAVSITIEFTVKATGKRLRDEELHDGAGKVIALRHYVDTAKHLFANTK